MITTVTINPAIDKTLELNNFFINQINRTISSNTDAGGKGINASKIISFLGGETTALGFLAGDSGKSFLNLIKTYNFNSDFVWAFGETRTNIKIIDTKNNTCTDINEQGPIITEQEIIKLKQLIKIYASKSQALILSGNAQKSIPQDIYKQIILENKNTKVFLDTSGDLLTLGIQAKPFFIKPNIEELACLLKKDLQQLNTLDKIIFEAKKLVGLGIRYVCVSMGKEGLLLATKDEILHAVPPAIVAKSTVGAGDSVVGTLALEILNNTNNKDALKLACAVSAACVTLKNTGVPNKSLVESILKNVNCFRLDT